MEPASKILVVAGVANIGYAFLLGLPLASIRMKQSQAPRYLILAHTGPIISGAVLLSLVLAAGLSDLSSSLETTAAWLLVGGTAAVASGDTINWLSGVQDGFAQRSRGWRLTALGGPVILAGLLILLVGVVKGV